MTNKVLKVDMLNGTATVGCEETQEMNEYSLNDFNFTPNVGDLVDIYKNNDKVMIVLKGSNYQQPQSYTTATGQSSYTVNKIAYGLLAIFLGNFGVHHFYAGDSSRGIKYLLISVLLCWTVIAPLVIEILSIVQGIQVLCMPADANGNVELVSPAK